MLERYVCLNLEVKCQRQWRCFTLISDTVILSRLSQGDWGVRRAWSCWLIQVRFWRVGWRRKNQWGRRERKKLNALFTLKITYFIQHDIKSTVWCKRPQDHKILPWQVHPPREGWNDRFSKYLETKFECWKAIPQNTPIQFLNHNQCKKSKCLSV